MKASRQTYLGVAIVAIVLLVSAVIGGRTFMWGVGKYSYGLAAATGALALFLYRERRDPALLLVGVGATAFVITSLVPSLVNSVVFEHLEAGWWIDLLDLSWAIGLVALVANLAFVVPWRERRGRPPLDVRGVVAATAFLIVALGILVAIWPRPEVTEVTGGVTRTFNEIGVAWSLILIVVTVGGLGVTIHSLSWSGRTGWVAAASLAIAAAGGALYLAFSSTEAAAALGVWWEVGPTLAVSSLLVFVLASLRLESSRQRRATDRATEVMEGRAEIASTIAHDVRGPVGTIKGLATTTRASYERLDDRQRLEFVSMIEDESTRLLRLVDQMSIALKVDARTLAPTIRRQEIAPLVSQALASGVADGREVIAEIPQGLEAPVDTRWLVEALRQGIDNAVRFSPTDSPITIEVSEDRGAVTMAIGDRGPGVPPEQREAVFEKFTRWRPAGYEERQGSGVGLFICRGIARMHGGDASIGEAPGAGTMLRIQIPSEDPERD